MIKMSEEYWRGVLMGLKMAGEGNDKILEELKSRVHGYIEEAKKDAEES